VPRPTDKQSVVAIEFGNVVLQVTYHSQRKKVGGWLDDTKVAGESSITHLVLPVPRYLPSATTAVLGQSSNAIPAALPFRRSSTSCHDRARLGHTRGEFPFEGGSPGRNMSGTSCTLRIYRRVLVLVDVLRCSPSGNRAPPAIRCALGCVNERTVCTT
jgi:hypothetical protein